MILRPAAVAVLLISFFGIAAELRAAPLVPLRTTEQGSVPAGAAGRLLVIDGHPVVATDGQAWLQDGARGWREIAWLRDNSLAGVFSDGQTAFALFASSLAEPAQLLQQLVLSGNQLSTRPLPPLPLALHSTHGAVMGNRLFVHGTDSAGSTHLFSSSLNGGVPGWSVDPGCDSASGQVEALVFQQDSLYAVVTPVDGSGQRLYRKSAQQNWVEVSRLRGQAIPGAVRAVGQAHLLFVIRVGETYRVMTFYAITGSWAELGEVPFAEIQSGAAWGKGLFLARKDGGQLVLRSVELEPTQRLLQPLDWAVIVIYLAGMAGIGSFCYWREQNRSTTGFFVGGRTIPFWAAGVSLYATNSSSISFIATTAKAFATNWQYLLNNLIGVLGLVFVAIWIVPLLRRLELMSVFQYLEQRFHRSVRLAASALCIAMHLGGRMSVILFLPSLAISTVTGLSVVWCIMLMGVVTIGYTALGGMKAVIWTDFAQLFVMFGGMLFAIGFIVSKLDGGVTEFLSTAMADDKMQMFDWSFDLTKATVWSIVFLVILEVVLTFPKDQLLMQRVFTTKSERDASRSVWMFAALIVPGSLMFYLIGTSLYVFYHSHPERMNPLLRVDATFPLFIAAELPAGITGLIIAGIFAASMSTLSSILNSVATLISVDFYEKLAKRPSQAMSIRLAEWVTVIGGLIGIGLALLLTRFSINSFLDVAVELAGLLGGSFGGAYTLGMFTRRANWQGVLIGMAASLVLTFAAWTVNMVHPLLYLAVSILISIVVGYLASWFFPAPPIELLRGLTILTPKRRAGAPAA